MKKNHYIFIYCLIFSIVNEAIGQSRSTPVLFIPNQGQLADSEGKPIPEQLYYTQLNGVTVYLSRKGVSYVFKKGDTAVDKNGKPELNDQPEKISYLRMETEFLGTNTHAKVTGLEQKNERFNFYYPHCPHGITDVRPFGKIIYKDIYPFIDLVYYSSGGNLKYDFLVHPGGKVSDIQFRYNGATSAKRDNNGKLSVSNPLGKILEAAPVTYLSGNEDQRIICEYNESRGIFSFETGRYNKASTLVIDPITYAYGSFIGGNSSDATYDLRIDPSGNKYLAGASLSTNFPVTTGAIQSSNSGLADGVVMKVGPNQNLIWATYYGGSHNDYLNNLALSNDVLFITGYSFSNNVPVTSNAFQSSPGGHYDALLLKLDTAGKRSWATYLGGANEDVALAIVSDKAHNFYVSCHTESTGFPVTSHGSYSYRGNGDATLSKFDSACNMIWSMFIGDVGSESYVSQLTTAGLILDSSNHLIFTSETKSTYFPTSSGAYQSTLKGISDIFAMKIDTASKIIWSTLAGGSGQEYVMDVCSDAAGNIFITGSTSSTDLPNTANRFQPSPGGGRDAFVMKFDSNGWLRWSTYIGGSSNEESFRIIADSSNNLWVTGETESSNFPVSAGNLWGSFAGGISDAFVFKLDTSGQRLWGTYFGGNGRDMISGLTREGGSKIWACGYSVSSNLPLTSNALNSSFAVAEGFIIRLNCQVNINVTLAGSSVICSGDSVQLRAPVLSSHLYKWSTGETTPWIYKSTQGNYSVTIKDQYGCSGTSSPLAITVLNNPAAAIALSGPAAFCEGDSAVLDAGGFHNFAWSTGDSSNSITVKTSGNYFVTVTDTNGCKGSDTALITVFTAPPNMISVSGPLSFCSGDSVTLAGISGYDNYAWSTADTGRILTAKLSGNYVLSMNDTNSCLYKDSVSVTAFALPQPVITHSTPLVFCEGDSVILSTGSYLTYNWSNGKTDAAITVKQAGIYEVTVNDTNGCTTISPSVDVKVNLNPVPLITAFGPLTFCQGDSVKLSSSDFPGYHWTDNSTTKEITVKQSGIINVTVTDSNGCKGTSLFMNIKVNLNPVPVITTSGPLTFCNGDSVRLISSGYPSYQWSNNANTPDILVKQSGSFSVLVTDTNGCKGNSVAIAVKVNALPAPIVTVTGSTNFCPGDSVILESANDYVDYLWSNNQTVKNITVKQTGNYSLTVTDSNGCKGSSAGIGVVVFNQPVQPVVTQSGNTLIAGNAFSYQWFQNGNTISGANAKVYDPPANGSYSVEITDSNGCRAISASHNFVNNGIDGIWNEQSLRIYPNPSAGVFNLELKLDNPQQVKFLLTDALGRVVMEFDEGRQESLFNKVLDIQELPAGVYTLQLNIYERQYFRLVVRR